MASSYESALKCTLRDLNTLVRRRAEIDNQISELRNIALALCAKTGAKDQKEKLMILLGQIEDEMPKFSEAVKDALYSADRPLPATQVRDVMELRGFSFVGLANPLANVHSTLRRLAAQGEIKATARMGQIVYESSGPHYGARRSLANRLASQDLAQKMDAKIRERANRALIGLGIYVQR